VEFRGCAVFVAPQHPLGVTVVGVDGLDDVRALPGVQAALPVEVGRDGPRRIGFANSLVAAVVATAPHPAAAVALWRQVMARVRPRYADAPGSTSSPAAPRPQAATPDPHPVGSPA
jgi:hypothetical protein